MYGNDFITEHQYQRYISESRLKSVECKMSPAVLEV